MYLGAGWNAVGFCRYPYRASDMVMIDAYTLWLVLFWYLPVQLVLGMVPCELR